MKANEFIKRFGVGEAKRVLHCMDDASEFKTHMPGDTWDKPTLIDAVGLRRLVESHELVGRYGTADEAKEYLPMLRMDSYDELKQAILDVESCQ